MGDEGLRRKVLYFISKYSILIVYVCVCVILHNVIGSNVASIDKGIILPHSI